MDSDTPRLLISERAIDEMTTAARRAQPYETGGILLGIYAAGTPWVTGIVELPTPNPSRNRYRIPAGATRATVQAARAMDPRLGYLGDWHSHPADTGHSVTDLASLALISARNPRPPMPTSIVLRRTGATYCVDARRIAQMHPRRCLIETTGNLPAAGMEPK